eukprot:gene30137-37301_t
MSLSVRPVQQDIIVKPLVYYKRLAHVHQTVTGGPCPPGHYCRPGSVAPIACPRGTAYHDYYNNGSHYYNHINFFCPVCPAGTACNGVGLKNHTDTISAGYWSVAGAKTAKPLCVNETADSCLNMYGICPRGARCPAGSIRPIPCTAGFYCPTGTAYVGNSSTLLCPTGHYCPFRSAAPKPCAAGTYQDETTKGTCKTCPSGSTNSTLYGLFNITDCQACPASYYCPLNGTVHATRKCQAGYYCPAGTAMCHFQPQRVGIKTLWVSGTQRSVRPAVIALRTALSPSPVQCPPGTNSTQY